MIVHALLRLSVVGLVSSTIYLILVLEAARRFRHSSQKPVGGGAALPPVTVLKPLHGVEPLLERNLESFFLQDYPDFEIIFSARHTSDPALKVVDVLRRKYPKIQSSVVLSGEPSYPNAKIFALEKMLACTKASYLVITDSDVCVRPDCLREVVAPLLDPRNGVVTCLYRGVAAGGSWSRLEALGMSVEMPSGVLVANMIEGMRFALGPTMATRKDVLESIGGVAALGQYCADDYVLGHLAYESGKRVVLSHHVIGHVAINTSARMSIGHQVRWMRSTRFSRSAGHIGAGLTYATPFGFLGLIAAAGIGHWPLGIGLLGWALLNRIMQTLIVGWRIVEDSESLKLCWLYPVRDLIGFFIWCVSFLGSEIVWRNERYRLFTGGKMERLKNANVL